MTEWKIHRKNKLKPKCPRCGRILEKEGHGHVTTKLTQVFTTKE